MTLAAMLDDAAARSPHAVAIHTSAVSFFRVDRWPLTAQGKLDRARLVWIADFGDGQEI